MSSFNSSSVTPVDILPNVSYVPLKRRDTKIVEHSTGTAIVTGEEGGATVEVDVTDSTCEKAGEAVEVVVNDNI